MQIPTKSILKEIMKDIKIMRNSINRLGNEIGELRNDLDKHKIILIEQSFKIDYLTSRIEELDMAKEVKHQFEQQSIKSDVNKRISLLLHEHGIPAHVKGFFYLKESIYNVYLNDDLLINSGKKLIPKIADHHFKHPKTINHAMRKAIEIAWEDKKIVRGLLKNKPSNIEFIEYIYRRLEVKEGI